MARINWKTIANPRVLLTMGIRYLWRNFDCIVLLLMMAAICNPRLSLSDQPMGRDSLNALDESWQIDLIFKTTQGIWSGRDFLFTYGPLWQLLGGILPRMAGVSTGSIFKLLYLFSYWFSFAFLFLSARLLLPRSEGWIRAVFLAAMVIFWLPTDVRIGFALLCFAVYVRLAESLPVSGGLLLRSVLSGAQVVLAFLFAMDAGFLSAAGLVIVLICHALLNWRVVPRRLQAARFAAGALASIAVGALLVNTWAAGTFNWQFWRWCLQMTSVYRWLMASAMTPEVATRLGYTVAVCAVVFAVAWFTRDSKSDNLTMRPLFVVAAALFSLVALQKGVVRSGWGHVSQCLFPMVALSGMVLVGYRHKTRPYLSHLGVLSAVALTLIFSGPVPLFGLSGVWNRWISRPQPYPSCPPGTYYADQVCFLPKEYASYVEPARYIKAHSGPADSIAVYPYENIFGLLSRRRVSAGVLQNYAIGGESLTGLQLAQFERDRPPLAVYCADELVSWPVDGISNFQRTAAVWLYLQSHYAVAAEPANGVLILQRNESRAASSHRTQSQFWRTTGAGDADSIVIEDSQWKAAPVDFLRIRARVTLPPWWKVLKPSSIILTLRYVGGGGKVSRVSLEPNHAVDLWVYPWEEVELRKYFSSDASQWRSSKPHPAVRSIQLTAEPYDLLSVAPSFIGIDAVDGVQLGLAEPRPVK